MPAISPSTLVTCAGLLLSACGGGDPHRLPADPRTILDAHISHGIGYSPFDSPLVHDSIAAEMIVRARECARVERLLTLHPDSAEGARLLGQLQSDGLVIMREGGACTTFPILLNDEQRRYATITNEAAAAAARELAGDLEGVSELLQRRGWSDWRYHFVWSQLFDSQFAWTDMMQRGLVPPLGRLVAWAVYPAHPLRSGTNYYPDTELRDYWLMVTWRAGAANTVGRAGTSWDIIYRAAMDERPLTAAERATLAELDLVDAAGQLQIPVLHRGDSLYDLLRSAAGRHVAFLEQRMPLVELAALSGVDRQHTFAMAYHDISWGVLDLLIRADTMEIPSALKRGANGTQPSLRGVVGLTPVHAPFADLIRAAIDTR